MNRKSSMIVILLVFVSVFSLGLTMLAEEVNAKTLYVGGFGPGNHTRIQDAIDNASSGDTIYVYSGIYYENVEVYKTLSLIGENRDTTVINGSATGSVVNITADWANITGFTVENSGSDSAGIALQNVRNCSITGNIALGNYNGIYVNHSDMNTITDNKALYNSAFGIHLQFSNNIIILNNNVSWIDNGDGIYLHRSNSVVIADNAVFSNFNTTSLSSGGLSIHFAINNTIANNTISSVGWDAIRLKSSSNNTIAGNTALSNGRCGVHLDYSVYNTTVFGNSISENGYGICLGNSDFNTIVHNNVSSTKWIGIELISSFLNQIHHNNFIDNNWQQAYDDGSNMWDDGYPSGGNYWSDYTGVDEKSGIDQDQPGSDGLGDTPYNISGGMNQDLYPLMTVVVGPPDIVAKSLTSNPPSPVASGTLVTLNATFSNDGKSDTSYFDVIFFEDRNHDRIIQIGEDFYMETVPILRVGENTSIYYSFTAEIEGLHDICVWADPPPGMIEETNEANNLLCMNLIVYSPAYPRPPSNLIAKLSGSDFSDVLLSWNLSPDDGNPSNPVVGYDVLRGTSYERNGTSYVPRDSVTNGTSQYTDVGAGEGNSNNYFYMVCAVSPAGNSSCSENQAGKFTRPLSSGPNLVSIPLVQSNESIETVLQTVGYDKAWYYDSSSQEWKWYMTSKGYRRGLWSVNHTTGIWMNVTGNCNLTVAGIVPAQTTIQIAAGWNLIGFPSFNTTYTVADLKASVLVEQVEAFDAPSPPYFLRVASDAEVLLAGEAYWVKVSEDTIWVVSNT